MTWISIPQFAKLKNVSKVRIYALIESGQIPKHDPNVIKPKKPGSKHKVINVAEAERAMKGSVKTKSKPESKQAESKQKEKKPKAAKRNRVTKTIRFEVFKRDGFTCTYCGKSPPEVELEVDHIDPHSQGGDDGIENYTTACFDCNRGKDDKPLDGLPQSILSKREDAEEKKRQVEELIKLSGFEPFGTLLEAQKHKETYTGYLKQLEFDEKKGNLLNADDVKKDAEKAARIVKERVTAWPGRTAPLVAPITDEFEVEQVLKLECDRLLEEISKAVVDESL